MPLKTQPEDLPTAVRFCFNPKAGSLEVSCATLPHQASLPYRIEPDVVHFESRDGFKAKVVRAGMSPTVAEDEGRSFNATARQLRNLGFSVELAKEEQGDGKKAA